MSAFDLASAEKILAWGNDLDAPNKKDNAIAEYLAECVRFREAHGKPIVTTTMRMHDLSRRIQENERIRKVLDQQDTSEAYDGTLSFRSGWARACFILKAAALSEGLDP